MRHSVPDEASLSCTYSSFSHSFPHFSSPTKWECVTFLSTREEKLRGVHFQTCTREASISARVSRTPAISVPLSELTVQSAWETTTETHLPQSRRWKLAEQYWNSQAEKNTHLWYNTLIPSASGLARSFPLTFSKWVFLDAFDKLGLSDWLHMLQVDLKNDQESHLLKWASFQCFSRN